MTGPASVNTSDVMRLSVVLPVLAERASVEELVAGLRQRIGGVLHEVLLVVAGGAPPETREICADLARAPEVRVVEQQRNPGLGLAVREGLAAASGSHILLMDSDGEMDVETVPRMVARMQSGDVDMVVGSRWARGGGVVGYDRLKEKLNRVYQALFRALYQTPVHDLTLGFKLARAEVLQRPDWRSQFHDIACETTLGVIRAGHRVTEVPTVWRCRVAGVSSNPFRRNWLYVRTALRIWLFGP